MSHCIFETGYAGKCGKVAVIDDRCARHLGKTQKPKRDLIGKYRGRSIWAEANGMFIKGESNGKND